MPPDFEGGGGPHHQAARHTTNTSPHHKAGTANSNGTGQDCTTAQAVSRSRPSHTAVAVWVDIATAPWFGSCTGCGHELHAEVAASDGAGWWLCVQCLTESVRAHVIRELGRRCA
jgi:hypothetical protein